MGGGQDGAGGAPSRHQPCWENVTKAQIAKPFRLAEGDTSSSASNQSGTTVTTTGAAAQKIVDYVLLLHTERRRPDNTLVARIHALVNSPPYNYRTINQTTYKALRYSPVAVSVETKVARGSLEEGRVQLGIWTAAWHKRVKMLRGGIGGTGSSGRRGIITLQLLTVQENRWKIYFAVDREEGNGMRTIVSLAPLELL